LKNYLTQILINKKQEENKKSFKEKHMNTWYIQMSWGME
jgi:hypothetical protein